MVGRSEDVIEHMHIERTAKLFPAQRPIPTYKWEGQHVYNDNNTNRTR